MPHTPNSVLVIDDDTGVLALVQLFLSTSGIDVETCQSSAEALERVKSGQFALVLTDYRMPEMDGLTLSRRIEVACPNVDVLFYTAFAEDLAIAGVPASKVIAKPADKATLVGIVRRILADKRISARMDGVEARVAEVHDDVKIIGAQVSEMTLAVTSIRRDINGRLDRIENTATAAQTSAAAATEHAAEAATNAAAAATEALGTAKTHAMVAAEAAIEALSTIKTMAASSPSAHVWPEIFRPFKHKAVAGTLAGASALITMLLGVLVYLATQKLAVIERVPKIERDIDTIRVGQQSLGENMKVLVRTLRREPPEPAVAQPSASPGRAPRRSP